MTNSRMRVLWLFILFYNKLTSESSELDKIKNQFINIEIKSSDIMTNVINLLDKKDKINILDNIRLNKIIDFFRNFCPIHKEIYDLFLECKENTSIPKDVKTILTELWSNYPQQCNLKCNSDSSVYLVSLNQVLIDMNNHIDNDSEHSKLGDLELPPAYEIYIDLLQHLTDATNVLASYKTPQEIEVHITKIIEKLSTIIEKLSNVVSLEVSKILEKIKGQKDQEESNDNILWGIIYKLANVIPKLVLQTRLDTICNKLHELALLVIEKVNNLDKRDQYYYNLYLPFINAIKIQSITPPEERTKYKITINKLYNLVMLTVNKKDLKQKDQSVGNIVIKLIDIISTINDDKTWEQHEMIQKEIYNLAMLAAAQINDPEKKDLSLYLISCVLTNVMTKILETIPQGKSVEAKKKNIGILHNLAMLAAKQIKDLSTSSNVVSRLSVTLKNMRNMDSQLFIMTIKPTVVLPVQNKTQITEQKFQPPAIDSSQTEPLPTIDKQPAKLPKAQNSNSKPQKSEQLPGKSSTGYYHTQDKQPAPVEQKATEVIPNKTIQKKPPEQTKPVATPKQQQEKKQGENPTLVVTAEPTTQTEPLQATVQPLKDKKDNNNNNNNSKIKAGLFILVIIAGIIGFFFKNKKNTKEELKVEEAPLIPV